MTLAVDLYVKHQFKQTNKQTSYTYGIGIRFLVLRKTEYCYSFLDDKISSLVPSFNNVRQEEDDNDDNARDNDDDDDDEEEEEEGV